jgi:DNA modification methylase
MQQKFFGKFERSKSLSAILNEIKKKPWKQEEFKKQSWGIWLHKMSPYVGRIKPAFAHWLIRICSKENDTILDPFCGIGTVLLEADLLGRIPIGIDLNSYAIAICKAKFDRRGLQNELKYLKNLKLNANGIDLSSVPEFVKEYYHPDTLKEIIALRDKLIEDKRFFLLGCLLGIAHGHRPTQHLSIVTGYIIPYIPNPKPRVEYREVMPRMIKKVERMYKNQFPLETKARIYEADTRKIPLEDNSADVIISSPPYYDTLDYISSNKLRLALLGLDLNAQEKLKTDLIQQRKTYLEEMRKTAFEVRRVLKPHGLCIFILGDLHTAKFSLNTAEDVFKVYQQEGFNVHGIVTDEIPSEKTTIVKFRGKEAIERKKKKLDRILIMTNEK